MKLQIKINRFTILIVATSVQILLTGCDQVMNRASAEFLKYEFKETCGEDDSACIAAVDTQFDACHSSLKNEWNNYMNSSITADDEHIEIYLKGIHGCIVDENQIPYFEYDPD